MEIKQLQCAIEAILFASGEPISDERLAQALDIDKSTVNKLMEIIIDKFESDDSGIFVFKMDNKYQMCSKALYADYVRKAMDIRKNIPLSPAAMEVLAIIAYNQPITKAFMEQVRGVDCSGVVSSLCSKNLVEEKGRLELPGKPLLYGTTPNFLRCFGINSLNDLPAIQKDFKEIEKADD